MTSPRIHSAFVLSLTSLLLVLLLFVVLPDHAAAQPPAGATPSHPAATAAAARPTGNQRTLFDRTGRAPAAPGPSLFSPHDLPVSLATPSTDDRSSAAGGDLLDPGPLAEDTADSEEPPLLARPDATLFTYGASVPRITCLPYRACTLLLSPDETLLDVAIGDSERWQIETFSAAGTAPTVVFKPTRANLLTNLVLKTDRRLYVLELLAPAPAATDPDTATDPGANLSYDALTAFRYPREWAQSVARPATASQAPALSQPAASVRSTDVSDTEDAGPSNDLAAAEPGRLHFDYTFDRPLWPRHRLPWTPDTVYDDGHRTFVHLPPAARRHPLPAVLRIDGGGEPVPLDTSLTGPHRDWLVIPDVAPRLRLVTRTGDSTRRLTLVRSGAAHRAQRTTIPFRSR